MAQRNTTHETRIAALEAEWRSLQNPSSVSSAEAVTLKEYFNTKLDSVEKASILATNAISSKLSQLSGEIDELKTFKDRLEGKASALAVYIAYAVALLGLAISIVGLLR